MPKQEVLLKTIKNVFFYYTSLSTPVLTKKAKDDGKTAVGPDGQDGEYVVKIAMSEETYKGMKKHPDMKGAKNFPNVKEMDLGDFEAAFHSETPEDMPDFGEDKDGNPVEDIVIVKFAQKSYNANAKRPMKAPNLIGIKGKVKDLDGNDIAKDTLLGNGTKGHLQVRPVEFPNKAHGMYLYPHAVCITNLVVYESAGGADTDYDAFGMEEYEEEEASNGEDLGTDDFDLDIPF